MLRVFIAGGSYKMAHFPIDEGNLSFSDNEYGDIFLTQTPAVDTQRAREASDFLANLDEFVLSPVSDNKVKDIEEVVEKSQSEMCEKIFDFSDDVDNGWSVSTQDNPTIVTRNVDGKSFVMSGNSDGHDKQVQQFMQNDVLPYREKELEEDLKRFSSVINSDDLDTVKRKR